YEDYPALRHLPAEEAVVQLLMPRFDQLAGLASALQQRNVLQVLLRVMSPDQAARLWRQWTGETVTALFRLEGAPSAAELASLHSWLQQSSLRAIDSDMPLVLATLHHLLECLVAREC